MTNNHLASFKEWVALSMNHPHLDWVSLTGDAGFRKYYRFRHSDGRSYIAVDAPPATEQNEEFIAVNLAFAEKGLHVPHIYHADLSLGFFIVADLGDLLYLNQLNTETVDALYRQALDKLLILQSCDQFEHWDLPFFDAEKLRQECELFLTWFLSDYCKIKLTDTEFQQFQVLFDRLIQSAQAQPQVCVHRDYHSRNLLVTPENSPGILDFQDAVLGPITYDVVSLLRDSYVAWPEPQIMNWSSYYRMQAEKAGLFPQRLRDYWEQWFDWMGMQRHIKVAGIFARLALRDGKVSFLKDIPRTLNYLSRMSKKYPEHLWLFDFLQERVLPTMLHLPALEVASVS